MSTRSKKTTSVRQVVQESSSAGTSSPRTPASGRSPGRSRPPSPHFLSRTAEKQTLADLNDRLASYIDRVRTLEFENNRLSQKVISHEETVSREVSSIKTLYESELADTRKLLDDIAKEKARLEVEITKLKGELDPLKDKYNRAAREGRDAEKKLLAAEAQANELQARLTDAVAQRKHWENEYQKLRRDMDGVEKKLVGTQKQLEEETVRRVDLENRAQSMKEELDFKAQVHQQELNESRVRTEVRMEEVDGRISEDYESRLAEALATMREENDEQIRITREETELLFSQKIEELRNAANVQSRSRESTVTELRRTRKQIDDLSDQVAKLGAQNSLYESRIRDLEARLKMEEDEHQAAMLERMEEIHSLRQSLADQLSEYQDLLDVKIQLDLEIAAYRKLLESEETRLNLSGSEGTPARKGGRKSTPGASSRKRKRTVATMEESGGGGMFGGSLEQASTSAGFSAKSSAKGSVEVFETNEEGQFIKLHNTSEKDVSLGGWQLKHTAGDNETTFKFHRTCHVKGGEYVTVWTSETETTHSPPTTLVMKGQKWFIGDDMQTVLINNNGEEMATRDMSRSQMRMTYSSRRMTSSDELDSGFEGDRAGDEKCVIQ